MTRLLPLIFLIACTAAPDYSLISDDGPQGKVTRPEPRPERVQTVCPPKSPRAGKPVRAGHEDVLCYGDPSDAPSETKEPPSTECTDAGKWIPETRYALGGGKQCA